MTEEKDTEWMVSCKAFTCWVKTAGQHGTKILDAAPIAKKWIGQNFIRFCGYYGIKIEDRYRLRDMKWDEEKKCLVEKEKL